MNFLNHIRQHCQVNIRIKNKLNNISPIEAFSLYKLNLLNSDEIVILSDYWIEKNICSNSLCELCTINNPIMSNVGPLFEESMNDLKIKEPMKLDAIETIIKLILKKIHKKEIDAEIGASFLYYDIHINFINDFPDKQYLGDNFGLEHIFCWLREIWDCNDGSRIFYYTDIPRNKALLKFKEHLYQECINRLNQ